MSCLLFRCNASRIVLRHAVFGILLSFMSSRVDAATVAVVPASLDVNAFADVLTVPLSKIPNVTLVDRAEIQRVIREQELALTQPQAVVKVGRLLNAEGIVLLEKRLSQEKKELLSLRTVAVRAGVVVLQDEFTIPFADVTAWATSYMARIEQILPKLNVRMEDAVAVSVGSLRSSVSTGDAGSLEQELTALLRLRLAHEPAVFLLERRNMEALQNEKGIAAAEEPFWNGAFIIDGTINRDIVSQSNVTIDARVAAPRIAAAEIRVNGTRDSLPLLINNLVTNILIRIGKKETAISWRPEAEAEKFFQEAQWAARWGVWQHAQEAADASWALGRRTRLVAAYRIVSRGYLALFMRGSFEWEEPDVYGFHQPPLPNALPTTASMLEIYADAHRLFAVGTNQTDTGWLTLGVDLLPVTGRVLDRYYERVVYREGHEEELRHVRSLARQVNELIRTNSALWSVGWRNDFQNLPRIDWPHTKHGPIRSLLGAWFDCDGIWFESPRDAAAMYRKVLEPSVYPSIRNTLVSARHVPLTGWLYQDRRELPSIWAGFLRDMVSSTNLQIRLDGLRMILAQSQSPDALLAAAEQLMEEERRNRVVMFLEYISPTEPERLTDLLQRIEEWQVPQFEQIRSLRDAAAAASRLRGADPEFGYEVWKGFLKRITETNAPAVSLQQPRAIPSPERAREIVLEIERLSPEVRRRWNLDRHLLQLKAVAAPEPQPKRVLPQTNATRSIAAPAPLLTISRVWRKDERSLPSGRAFTYRWMENNMFWQEDHLWVEGFTQGTRFQGDEPRLALLKFDTSTMRPEVIEAPFEYFIWDMPRKSVVRGKEVFVRARDAVWRRDAAGQWKKYPVPDTGYPVLWENSVVMKAGESITQLMLDTGEVRVLASTRRNPAVSVLDTLNLNNATLAVWPDNSLCMAAAGRVWKFDPKQNDWGPFITATNCGESLEVQSQGAFYRQSGECGGPRLLGGWRPGVANLDYFIWSPSRRTQDISQSMTLTPPIWKCTEPSVAYNRVAQFEGSGIWIFPHLFNPSLRVFPREASPSTLLFLDPTLDQALEIGIDFAPSLKEEAEAYKRPSPPPAFLATPKGLAIELSDLCAVLWIPKADIDAALAKARQRQNASERLDAGKQN